MRIDRLRAVTRVMVNAPVQNIFLIQTQIVKKNLYFRSTQTWDDKRMIRYNTDKQSRELAEFRELAIVILMIRK